MMFDKFYKSIISRLESSLMLNKTNHFEIVCGISFMIIPLDSCKLCLHCFVFKLYFDLATLSSTTSWYAYYFACCIVLLKEICLKPITILKAYTYKKNIFI